MDPEEEFPPRSKNHGKQVRWDKRDEGSEKYIRNQIKTQHWLINKAEQALAEALDRGTTDSDLAKLQANVTTQHVKLYRLGREV